jgi:hypothetical protein
VPSISSAASVTTARKIGNPTKRHPLADELFSRKKFGYRWSTPSMTTDLTFVMNEPGASIRHDAGLEKTS